MESRETNINSNSHDNTEPTQATEEPTNTKKRKYEEDRVNHAQYANIMRRLTVMDKKITQNHNSVTTQLTNIYLLQQELNESTQSTYLTFCRYLLALQQAGASLPTQPTTNVNQNNQSNSLSMNSNINNINNVRNILQDNQSNLLPMNSNKIMTILQNNQSNPLPTNSNNIMNILQNNPSNSLPVDSNISNLPLYLLYPQSTVQPPVTQPSANTQNNINATTSSEPMIPLSMLPLLFQQQNTPQSVLFPAENLHQHVSFDATQSGNIQLNYPYKRRP